jgi:site-specific DNA recombinase
VKLRCSAYARYSSDQQSPASIEDQLRRCYEYANTQGWEVLGEYVYTDEELSGSGADRPGWIKLRAAVTRKPRPFDILLVDDTSRLSRNLGEISSFMDEVRFLEIGVIAVSQGIDSRSKTSKVVLTIHGLTDEMFLEELASKTHRGLEGRALKGLNTGGRCYGYDNVPVDSVIGADGVPAKRRQINEAEAEVIRRIFQMYANYFSLKSITKTLNTEHVPPPRKRRDRSSPTWCPSAIREMLRRELYIGQIVWNRRKFVKVPRTNKRVSRQRPESERVFLPVPDLRIVDQELWDRVQKRIAFVAEEYNYANRPGLTHRASTSPYLLTGILKCGACGHNLIIVTGRGNGGHPRYGCPINFNRGACANGVKLRADEIEARLFSDLQNAVLQPEAIEYAVQEFERQLQSSLSALDTRIGQMRQRASQLQKEIANLAATAAQCGPTPVLVKEINNRQEDLEDITRQILGTEPDTVSAEIGRIRRFVTGQLGDIRQLLTTDVRRAKAELQKHIAEIRMVPQTTGKKGYYTAEGNWDLLGGYADGGEKPARMVAGGGFEPPTFGL